MSKSKVLRNNDIEIMGKVSLKMSCSNEFFNAPDRLFQEKEKIEQLILEAKGEYKKIVQETELKKQEIINEANENAKTIEKRAYELGYEQGLKNGYEDGYKESYEENIDKAIKESEEIKKEAYNTLLNIKSQIKEYIKYNKEQVLNISIKIAEQVLREKFKDTSLMNIMLDNIINEYDLKNDLVIKVNPRYKEEFQKNIDEKIPKNNSAQKIFILSDSSIEEGNAEVEDKNGKLIVGIDSVLEKVKEELL